ncbi:2-oxoglutarate dehydrogenase complex E2 component [Boothiomyces macroporosus]|uniref:2-oxoglutarate dehydrogenase complex E2 component n=1 Tax=Boothiomyces macroporosus TaxID=261099 RepID=A0AAD5Y4E9_9FUNG|nr:2-oxoglutarate dehydrogenase complex E2 component [Boothiomyces macroporosus]
MGESITEGTLTQWHKKIGDFVNRDEQIATIETDKIDVQVNSPESGVLLELFSAEGDTVSVGGQLFKIDTDKQEQSNSAPVQSKPEVKAETKPEVKPEPVKPQTVKPAAKTELKSHRTPLIKFLGPRKLLWQSSGQTVLPPTQSVTIKNGTRTIQYESLDQLPKRFQPVAFSLAEMEAIDNGGADHKLK